MSSQMDLRAGRTAGVRLDAAPRLEAPVRLDAAGRLDVAGRRTPWLRRVF